MNLLNNLINTPVVDDLKTCPNKGPCLLCVSDLEGCMVQSLSNIPQHAHLCSDEFFQALANALTNNGELHIVFLGDYFDLGPHIAKSITRIMELKNKYTDRIHIILGNRDVNKMRIALEINLSTVDFNNPVWLGIDMIRDEINRKNIQTPIPLTRTEVLLKLSYGAGDLLKNLSTELSITEEECLDLFVKIFSNENIQQHPQNEFISAVRDLFKSGKLIEIINVGGTKFLASHSGTSHVRVFDKTALDIIIQEPDLQNTEESDTVSAELSDQYFGKIEEYRKKLIIDTSSKPQGVLDLNGCIDVYNQLLSDVVTKALELNIEPSYNTDGDFRKKYLLLQALGLKMNTTEQGNPNNTFMSPIESCGVSGGCLKFNPPPQDFVDLMVQSEIKGCIHGHIPFCGTVPLIFKTPHGTGIVEIDCDTSNGNRPKGTGSDEVTLDKVPLAIVYETSAGITSVDASGNFSNENTLGLQNNGTDGQHFKGMIGNFKFDDENFPHIVSEKEIKYPDGKFKFGEKMYGPSSFEKGPTVGGKRTKRNKNNKNKITRKNRKTKNKKNKNRRGKSMRPM